MAINFPTSLDTLTNPETTNPLNSPSHAGQHSDVNDAIEAIEAKIGINGSTDANSIDYKLDLKATQFPGICAETPILASDISIDYTTRVLTINRAGGFHYFTDGNGVITKHVVAGAVSFPAFTDTSGVWNFYFDNSGNAQVAQGNPPSFDSIAMVYRLLWNATLSGSAKAAVEAFECHDNSVSGIDHSWKHKWGTIWLSGGDCVNNKITTGTPNADGRNTVISLTTLNNLDDNLSYTITNSTSGSIWQQDLGNITPALLTLSNSGLFKVRLQNAGGLVSYLPATRFPFAWDTGTNRPEYITSTGTRTLVPSGDYFVYYVYSIQDPRNGEAIKIVSALTSFGTLTNAQASTWNDLLSIYPTLADGEIRPLYKLLFLANTAWDDATKNARLHEVTDIRVGRVTTSTASGSVIASSVSVVPAGNIASTNVQSALEELDSEKAPALGADDNYVTDAEKVKISNLSGTNTGDEVVATGAEVDTGTDNTKMVTPKAMEDSSYAKTSAIPVKASSAEINTGTDDAKFVTPDGFSGSNFGKRIVQLKIADDATAITTGDSKLVFMIPVELNGMNLVDVEAFVSTVSSSGLPTIQIRNITDSVDMLSTKITIDASEFTSLTATTAPVIDTTKDDVATGDLLAIDIDVSGTGAKGLGVQLSFQLP